MRTVPDPVDRDLPASPEEAIAILSTALDYACQRLAQTMSGTGGFAASAIMIRSALLDDAEAAIASQTSFMEMVGCYTATAEEGGLS